MLRHCYRTPDLNDPAEKLAYIISKIHNDNAPLGWESYIPLAKTLIHTFEMSQAVVDYPVVAV